MTDPNRIESYYADYSGSDAEDLFCDNNVDSEEISTDWKGSSEVTGKYYRFDGESFNGLATGFNEAGNCGTYLAGYIDDPKAHEIGVGQRRTNVTVCFDYGCGRNVTIKVTRCPGDPDFFVYHLPNSPCTGWVQTRYCGGMTPSMSILSKNFNNCTIGLVLSQETPVISVFTTDLKNICYLTKKLHSLHFK